MYLRKRNGERGAALVEFAIGGLVFFTALFGVLEMGRFFWTHAALRDATRKGARYATVRKNDAALPGHQRLETTAIYTTPSQRDLERVVEKLEQDGDISVTK